MIERIDNTIKASLIFVNYRSIFRLSLALQSLRSGGILSDAVELIVVNQDDMEREAMRALAAQWGFKHIDRENFGFASGANAGARIARGSVLGFLNPDIRYRSGSLDVVWMAFEQDPSVGIIGATLCGADGMTEVWSRGQSLTLLRLLRNNAVPSIFFSEEKRLDWVSGGALFVRKETFSRLNGFDEDFFLYFEDMDLCDRFRANGYSIQCAPTLQFIHHGGMSFPSRHLQKQQYGNAQRRYFEKHGLFMERQLFSLLSFIQSGIRIW